MIFVSYDFCLYHRGDFCPLFWRGSKTIQKMELERALIESDKVVELTNNKYINADKSQSISNEINKNENKLSQDSSVKSKGDIFAKVVI